MTRTWPVSALKAARNGSASAPSGSWGCTGPLGLQETRTRAALSKLARGTVMISGSGPQIEEQRHQDREQPDTGRSPHDPPAHPPCPGRTRQHSRGTGGCPPIAEPEAQSKQDERPNHQKRPIGLEPRCCNRPADTENGDYGWSAAAEGRGRRSSRRPSAGETGTDRDNPALAATLGGRLRRGH
jgi:hypothetical protein